MNREKEMKEDKFMRLRVASEYKQYAKSI
jgi:hypothetical protein